MKVEIDEEAEEEAADVDQEPDEHDFQISPKSNDPLAVLEKVLQSSIAQGISTQAIRAQCEKVLQEHLHIPGVEAIGPLTGEEDAEPIELN